MLRIARGDMHGRSVDALLTPSNRLIFHMQVLTLLNLGGRVSEIALSLSAADGLLVPVLLNAVRRKRAEGFISECVVTAIHERKRLEDDLFKIKKATEQAPGAVFQFQLDPDGHTFFPYASEGMRSLYGINPLLLGKSDARIGQIIHPDDKAGVMASMAKSARELGAWHQIYRILVPRRGLRWLEWHAMPEQRSDGSVLWHGYVHDTTQRKSLELALSREAERTRVTLRSIGDAVITTNAQGLVEYLNPAAEQLTGWLHAQAVGQRSELVFNTVNQHTRLPAENPVARCLSERTTVSLDDDTVLIARDGREYGIDDSAAPIFDRDAALCGAVLVFHDVSHQRAKHLQVAHRATHDHLTGLTNRAEFERRSAAMFDSTRAHGTSHAMCCIDLDRFKIVNDSCGHAAGDQLLQQVANLLQRCVRSVDTVARLGGDEFGLLLENCDLDAARGIAQKVCDAVAGLRFEYEARQFHVGASIGLVPIDRRWDSAVAAQQAADSCCFAAKAAGRGRVNIYQENNKTLHHQQRQMHWSTRIEEAIEHDRFLLYAQPIKALGPQMQTGLHFEVLLRLKDDDGNIVLPGAFLPSAERYGLCPRLDRWVLSNVITWLQKQPEAMADIHMVAINVSGHSVSDPEFKAYVGQMLETCGLPPEKLCFEITETAAIGNIDDATQFFQVLHAYGAMIALDDFGTGTASMAYLRRLPIDYLKIDGQFVKDMASDKVDFAIVKSINEISHLVRKRTIAEFVENAAILDHLHAIGMDYAQGYHVGVPVPIAQIVDWVDQTGSGPAADLQTQTSAALMH